MERWVKPDIEGRVGKHRTFLSKDIKQNTDDDILFES